MNLKFTAFIFTFLLSIGIETRAQDGPEDVPASQPEPVPKLNDYSENTRISGLYPESKVSITVGEKNGFYYIVNGITHSNEKISVSGQYYNNEFAPASGYAWLFLGADSGIAYFDYQFNGNRMEVYVENFKADQFYYEVIPPNVVAAQSLRISQVNETAVLISGPSRSFVFSGGYKQGVDTGSEVKV